MELSGPSGLYTQHRFQTPKQSFHSQHLIPRNLVHGMYPCFFPFKSWWQTITFPEVLHSQIHQLSPPTSFSALGSCKGKETYAYKAHQAVTATQRPSLPSSSTPQMSLRSSVVTGSVQLPILQECSPGQEELVRFKSAGHGMDWKNNSCCPRCHLTILPFAWVTSGWHVMREGTPTAKAHRGLYTWRWQPWVLCDPCNTHDPVMASSLPQTVE